MVAGEPQSIWALGAALLEGPVWVEREQALWFVDIKGQKLHRLDPASGARQSWDAPDPVGFCLPAADGGFLAGLKSGLARFDPESGRFTPHVNPEPDLPGNRLNDAAVDPSGRLWFGTMDDAEVEATGRIYRLAADGCCIPATPFVSISNGPAFSPDGRTIYHVDTLRGRIHAATIAPDGSLRDPHVLVEIRSTEGYPDGPSVDAEGCIWVGLYHGWSARRYSPTGELLDQVRFPVSAVTKVAFGGPDLSIAFATTAAKHLGPEDRAAEPQAGDLFSFVVPVPGLVSPPVSVGL
jgi:sugar lactone lactonase YvrE